MENAKIITIDSLSNVYDLIDDGTYECLEDFFEETQLSGDEHGIEVTNFETDEEEDIITAEVKFNNLQDVKDWMADMSPELSDEDIEDLLTQA